MSDKAMVQAWAEGREQFVEPTATMSTAKVHCHSTLESQTRIAKLAGVKIGVFHAFFNPWSVSMG